MAEPRAARSARVQAVLDEMITAQRKARGNGVLKDYCPDRAKFHTSDPDEPSGYLAWHEWVEKKAKTHQQKRCPTCGLFVVYVPRRRDG